MKLKSLAWTAALTGATIGTAFVVAKGTIKLAERGAEKVRELYEAAKERVEEMRS